MIFSNAQIFAVSREFSRTANTFAKGVEIMDRTLRLKT